MQKVLDDFNIEIGAGLPRIWHQGHGWLMRKWKLPKDRRLFTLDWTPV